MEDPDNAEGGYGSVINENSLRQLKGCKLEACMVDAPVGTSYSSSARVISAKTIKLTQTHQYLIELFLCATALNYQEKITVAN